MNNVKKYPVHQSTICFARENLYILESIIINVNPNEFTDIFLVKLMLT